MKTIHVVFVFALTAATAFGGAAARRPGYSELRARAWQAAFAGADGAAAFVASPEFLSLSEADQARVRDDLRKVALHLRRHAALLQSTEKAPAATATSADLAVRAFVVKGRTWFVAVNTTARAARGNLLTNGVKAASLALPSYGLWMTRVGSVNYDKAKVPPYQIADPLVFADGTPLKTAADWPRRRAEIVEIFAREMYGREPPPPEAVVCETFEKGDTLGGQAVREQTRMWFKADKSGPYIDWLLVRPRYAKGPVPVVLQLNYYGNHDFLTDREVVLPHGWMQNEELSGGFAITDNRANEAMRGRLCRTDQRYATPVDGLIARGYAFLTATYADVSPDPERLVDDLEEFPYTGVFELWGPRDASRTDNPTALGAWAWALSRGLDLAVRHPDLDAKRSVVTGCSRLGKAALLAAVRDERFAVCVPNQTGKGGVPLAKRFFGENVHTEMLMFPHWFCAAYRKYADNEQALPFDQHLLLAAVAPRALLVEGYDRDWFDPHGEWLSVKAASPVWTFLGQAGLPSADEPDFYSTSAVGTCLGYVKRKGQHGLAGCDWHWLASFADGVFRAAP